MSDAKKRKMLEIEESREQKQSRFIEMFMEEEDWSDEDLVAFIVDEFDGNVEDINWILKTALTEDEPSLASGQIVEVLVENNIELQVLNDLGQTAIHIAANNEDLTTMELLFKCAGNENLSDKEGFTYLHAACMSGCSEIVQKFIDHGADVNLTFEKNGRLESPLGLCIKYGSNKVLKLLLNNGADLKLLHDWSEDALKGLKSIRPLRYYYGRSCPWTIIANHHLNELLKHKKNSETIENRGDSEGFTYLHGACMAGNIEMVQKFIDQKVDLDLIWRLPNGKNKSPLTLAMEFNQMKILEMLLKNGANPHMKLMGKNLLHIYFNEFYYDFELLELLISYNCDLNAKDDDGRSPLFLCYKNCNEECISERPQMWANNILSKLGEDHKHLEILLKNKADVNEVFDNGQSILHLFIRSNICTSTTINELWKTHPNVVGVELVKTLLQYGADPNAKDDNGDSPLQLAVSSNNSDVVEVLLEHGADVQSVDISKLHWDFHWSVGWLNSLIKFFMILNFLIDKGFKLNESIGLTVLKLLDNAAGFGNKISLHNKLYNTLLFGSLTQTRSLLNDVKSGSDDQFEDDDKKTLAKLLYVQIKAAEKGNMFMTAEMKDYVQQFQNFFITSQIYIDLDDSKIQLEIEYLKKLTIKDGVSLLDVCTYSPEKAYSLIKEFNFRTIINSDDFDYKCKELSDTIKGYIVKCFISKIFVDIGLKY
ncbi:uncharacterized protein LOC106651923 [Trichogramma pretiosum]|uniref:uncharacterized protein LOC106651923 n=1 Tax=Trichogramma pretiosum TaxID=7493 RepID=UPI0006C99737|nr:uncharacterized protein LOC106651923 [Trichogramma pretiosum]